MNVMCAFVPRFPVALARRDRPEVRSRSLIVGRTSETRGDVIACSGSASRAGVVVGIPISRALVLCPTAAVVPLHEDQHEAARRAFLREVTNVSPQFEEIEPGHVHADIRGMAQLYGLTEEDHLADLQATLAGRTGLPVRVGSASSLFVAHAAASCLARPVYRVTAKDTTSLLAPLSVDALPVSAEMLRRLRLFGIDRLGQLAALPPTALQAQFGREGARAWGLVHGEDVSRIVPARDEIRVTEHIDLPAPAVVSAPLVLATDILLARGLKRREIDGRSLRRVDWTVVLENDERLSQRFVFREPLAAQAEMLFVIRSYIERMTLAAPALGLEVMLSGICSEYARQERLWRTGPRGEAALGKSLEQLAARTGAPQVYRIVEVEPWSRIPERQRAMAAYSP